MTDPWQIANCFNNYFVDVVEDMLGGGLLAQSEKFDDDVGTIAHNKCHKFRCPPIDEQELISIFNSLKNKWSSGYDDVPVKVIKLAMDPLIKPIMHLINASFISGIFPEELKISKVVPVYKKGDETEIQNYRPISILPSISKLFEKAMFLRLTKHLEQYNLLNQEQHGFRKNKSTVTALINFVESIIESINEKNKVCGIFMDLSRAFDSISHTKMISKLKKFGIQNSYLKWFESYLANRVQFVEITKIDNNQILKYKSKSKIIKYGVPQGSILGPLLFISYMNDLPKTLSRLTQVKNQLCLYADDSNLIMSAKTELELEINSFVELAKIQDFFTNNNLILNTQKTNYILFGTKQSKCNIGINICIDEKDIVQVHSTKFLGLFIDRYLTWDLHVDYIMGKINSGIYALKRLVPFCELKVLKDVFHALIQSHVSYGISVYGGTANQNLNKILIGQKRALRAMLDFKNNESVKQHFGNLEILTVYGLYILECIMFVKNNTKNYITHKDIHNYDTRNRNNLILPQHNLEIAKKKTSYNGIKFLSVIPKYIRDINDNKKFRGLLKEFLIRGTFYSLEEFYNVKNVENK